MTLHLSRAARLLTIITLCTLIEGALLLALVAPTISEIRTLRTEVDARRRDLEARYERGARVNAIRAAYQTLEPSMKDWEKIFLPEDSELVLITDLETLAGRHGVTQIMGFQKTDIPPNAPPHTRALPLHLNLSGSFSALLAYLRSLEKFPIVYSIESWEMTKQLASSELAAPISRGALSMTIQGTIWQRDVIKK